jgi:hypothetical protein
MRGNRNQSIARTCPTFWRVSRKPNAVSSQPTLKSRPPFAASIDEAPVYAARPGEYLRHRPLHPISKPGGGAACSAICESLQDLILFPQVGRLQQTQGVRKFVTPRYAYLIYYIVDDAAGEIIILSVKHSAQKRDHEDA